MLCTILRILVTIILFVLAIRFAWRNFIGILMKVVASLVLCALALVLVALVFSAIKIIGWFVFSAVCLFGAWFFLKMIKG